MKKASKRRASIYLVRYHAINSYTHELSRFVELFFNKKDAEVYQREHGGVLTRWQFAEQIELKPRRGKK